MVLHCMAFVSVVDTFGIPWNLAKLLTMHFTRGVTMCTLDLTYTCICTVMTNMLSLFLSHPAVLSHRQAGGEVSGSIHQWATEVPHHWDAARLLPCQQLQGRQAKANVSTKKVSYIIAPVQVSLPDLIPKSVKHYWIQQNIIWILPLCTCNLI
jgi:hypothetical protein